jgi:hypothetical protein
MDATIIRSVHQAASSIPPASVIADSIAPIRDAAPSWMAAWRRGTPPDRDPAGAPAGDVVDGTK